MHLISVNQMYLYHETIFSSYIIHLELYIFHQMAPSINYVMSQ